MELHQIIEQLRIYLERLGYAANTIDIIIRCTSEFIQQIYLKLIRNLQDITPADIIDHYNYLNNRPNQYTSGGLSSIYITQHIYSLKIFFEWLQVTGRIIEHPMSSLDFPKGESTPRSILTLSEVELLYSVCESWKEKAMLSIYYGCGLRRTEGELLNLSDVHFRSGILYVRKGKGRKRRAIPMHEKVANPIYQYIYEERFNPNKIRALIINNTNSRMRGASYDKLLQKIMKRTSIDKKITLHCLRHSIGTHLLQSGMDIEKVREFLGHKHLESTMRYTRVYKEMLYDLS